MLLSFHSHALTPTVHNMCGDMDEIINAGDGKRGRFMGEREIVVKNGINCLKIYFEGEYRKVLKCLSRGFEISI